MWMYGARDPRQCTTPSAGDIARIVALYPNTRAPTSPEARDLGNNSVLAMPAFKVMIVAIGNVTRTVRPIPQQTPFEYANDDFSDLSVDYFSSVDNSIYFNDVVSSISN